MSGVKTWLFSACLSAIVGGTVHMLLPSGTMEKVMKMVVGVFLVSCLILPLSGMDSLSFDVSRIEQPPAYYCSQLQSALEAQTEEYAQESLRQLTENAVKSTGATEAKITILMDKSDSSGISIIQAEIILGHGDKDKKDAVRQAVRSSLGIDATVTTEGETSS